MACMNDRWTADIERATRTALAAAAAIRALAASARTSTTWKPDESPVTAADLAADAVIRAALEPTGDTIVTEETWGSRPLPPRGRVWIVDPLDGTSDFVAGRSDYVVQIALVVDGVPTIGVLCHPPTGTLWRGVVDAEASRCERLDGDAVTPLRLSMGGPVAHPPRVCVSVSHPSAVVDAITTDLGATVVPMGSVGLKIGAIVDGRADLYVSGSRRIKVWDTAAPAAVLVAAGGVMTSLGGQPLRYDDDIHHDDGVAALAPSAMGLRAAIDAAIRRFTAIAASR
jgi:3'(2'), 5'-bisphosphate nucleotidase